MNRNMYFQFWPETEVVGMGGYVGGWGAEYDGTYCSAGLSHNYYNRVHFKWYVSGEY